MPKLRPFKQKTINGQEIRREEESHNWKGDAIKSTGRHRAVSKYLLGPCERCGLAGTDRHHKDGNTKNNIPENIEILCRKCHMETDGRMDALKGFDRSIFRKPMEKCRICTQLYKPLRRGKCHRCNEFFRRNGFDWELNRRYEAVKTGPPPCINCGQRKIGWSKGRCGACRVYRNAMGKERPERLFSKK